MLLVCSTVIFALTDAEVGRYRFKKKMPSHLYRSYQNEIGLEKIAVESECTFAWRYFRSSGEYVYLQ